MSKKKDKKSNQKVKNSSTKPKKILSLEEKIQTIEEELSRIRRNYNGLFEQTNDAIFIISLDGKYLDVNQQAATMLGYEKEDLIGLNAFNFIVPEEVQDAKRKLTTLQKKQTLPLYERIFCRKDGTTFPVEINASLIYNENKEALYIQSICRDISKRNQIKKELIEKKEQYQLLLNNAKDAILFHLITEDGKLGEILEVNDIACEKYGYTREEFKELTIKELDDPQTYSHIPKIIDRLLEEETILFEGIHLTKEGKKIPVEIHSTLVELEGQQAVLSVARDITKRKLIQKKRDRERQVFRVIAEAAIYTTNISDLCRYVIENLLEILKLDGGSVRLYNKKDHILEPILVIGYSEKQRKKVRPVDIDNSKEILSYVAKKKTGIFAPDVSNNKIAQDYLSKLKQSNFQAFISYPLLNHTNELLGTIQLASANKMEARNDDHLFFETIANMFATALEEQIAQDNLRATQKKLQSALEVGKMTWWEIDIPTGEIQFDKQKLITLGYNPQEFTEVHYLSYKKIVHPQDFEALIQEIQEHLEGKKERIEIDFRIRTIEGSWKWFHNTGMITEYDDENNPLKIGGMIIDITEQKSRAEKLRLWDLAIKSSINAIAFADLEGKITFVNRAFLKMWGYKTRREVLGRDIILFWRNEKTAQRILTRIHQDGSWQGEAVAKRKDGSLFSVEISTNIITNTENQPVQIMGSFIDITERKKALEALQESEEKYRIIVENSHAAIVLIDGNFNIIYVNDEASNLSGYSKEELINSDFSKYLAKESRDFVVRQYIGRRNGEKIAPKYEFQLITKDGKIRDVEVRASVIQRSKGQYLTVAQMLDITEQKRAYQKLQQQKQELESFASTITHDIRGKLQVISMYTEFIQESEYREKIDKQLKDIQSFLANLLLIAKKGDILGRYYKVSLEKIIKEIAKKLSPLQPELEIKVQKLSPIKADPIKLRQVFENLLMNVIEHSQATEVRISSQEENNYVKIFIQDNGQGISKERQKKILQTLRTTSYHTSGLNIVKKIIEAHQGEFSFVSKKGEGTTFIIEIPKEKPKKQ
ncbi:MAG: PAS domain S-box protein [Candidatus Heimdallarchaeota archaeon]|nr:PAS domain S-box protein [Candidatus Heimdallarchaeota archaeon]